VRQQGFAITFQRFFEPFQAVAQAAFVEVSQGHGAIRGDGLIIALDGFVQAVQPFQGPFFTRASG